MSGARARFWELSNEYRLPITIAALVGSVVLNWRLGVHWVVSVYLTTCMLWMSRTDRLDRARRGIPPPSLEARVLWAIAMVGAVSFYAIVLK